MLWIIRRPPKQHIDAAIYGCCPQVRIRGEALVEMMDMALVVRVYDKHTERLKVQSSKAAADYVVEESDDADLKEKKISLQKAFQKLIRDSAIFSIMVTESLIEELPCLLHYVKEHAEIVRAQTRYSVALAEAREVVKKHCQPDDQWGAPDKTPLDPSAATGAAS